MTNDEIKELLRDLAQKAEEEGEVKSKKIRISLTPEQPEEIPEPQPEDDAAPEKPSRAGGGWFASLKGKLSSLRRPKGEDGETAQEAAAETSEESTEEITEEAMEESMEESAESSTQEAAEADVEKAVEEEEPVAEEEFFDEPDGDGTVYLDQDDDTPGEETASGRAERSSGETDDVEPAPAKKKAKREKRQKKRQFSVMEPEVNRRGELVEPADFESDEAEFLDDETHKEMERAVMQQKGTIRQRTNAVRTALKGKGIGTKELIMIAAGILLCLLIAAVVLSVIGTRRKSANVTTDEGLTVTVEKEPAKWCTHGDVVLGIRTNSPIQSVLVNGNTVDYTGSTKTQIALDANTDTLELMVVTEAEVMNASVKLEKIDAADPQIAVSIQDGKVHLDATDDASGVDALWYGIKEAFLEVPLYQPYTEPFEPESGKQYAYFAVDHAGNATDPVVTTLTPATALTVPATEYSLFPGETADLQIAAEPAGGFINGLQITSDNEEAVVVQEDQTVLAVADGEANVVISAEGLASVTCHVTVRSSASLTISAVGDVTLGDDVNFSPLNNFTTVQSMYGNTYFFDNVRSIFEADDITFANLEGTLTDQGIREEKQYAFRGDPSYVQILKDGSIEAVTLANNHSRDYGEVSLTDTQKHLDEAGIEWCNGDKIILKEVNGVKVALIGIYVLADGEARASQVESTIAEAQEAGARIIVVAFHWGTERESTPDSTQKTLGRLAIDCGADLVVGHHPHVLQGIEKYSGKYICYSLGNFCFGGNSNPSDMDTMIFQQTFQIKRGGVVEADDATVIPCRISSIDTWNNYQPTPATGNEADRIMARINELCEPFKTSF